MSFREDDEVPEGTRSERTREIAHGWLRSNPDRDIRIGNGTPLPSMWIFQVSD